jgi:RNA polymerase sigma-70 factor (ECF subfamily)
LDPEQRADVEPDMERIFTAKLAEARVYLAPDDDEAFAAYAAERLSAGPLRDGLKNLFAQDLALAFSLARGRPSAIELFERDYVPALVAAVRKAVPTIDPADSVQEVRIHVLVGDGENPPRIRDYRGAGPLRGWLRVAVLRTSLNRATRASKETPVEDAFFEALVGSVDLSTTSQLFASRHTDAVKEALRHAVPLLSNREKSLLQYAFVDGASLEEMAATYGAHRSTIARWLELARDRVKRGVETYLRERLGLSPSEADSLVRHTMTAMDSTVGRLLSER